MAALYEPAHEEVQALVEQFASVGQEHLFTFWDELSSEEKASLWQQLKTFDIQRIAKLSEEALNPPPPAETPVVEPLPTSATASILDSPESYIKFWYDIGLDIIGAGEVAVVLMAGGQGTRLGSSAPKGCFDVGLPSHKSLFQLQAERIIKVQELAAKKVGKDSVVIPWYVMTSGPTRGPTQAFFEQNNYFGLEKENVMFFEQGVLPCISNDGKIILESKSRVAVAPDGNGGIYRALMDQVIPDMKVRGIQHVHAYCVDNSLVRVADPVFIGFSASKDVDLATKVVRKRNATESVGLILLKNGKPDVVEYSEIDAETAEARDAKNPEILKFRAANIVNHYYTVRFLETIPEWVDSLPHHIAKKKIPYTDLTTGEQNKPSKPNGIKLEQFVFDIFPRIPLSKFACMEVKREDEFSPLKNARGTGEDDPDTSRHDVLNQGKRWVEAAGGVVSCEDWVEAGVEISPLVSYGGEGLSLFKGRTITGPAATLKLY
ncbi:UTP-glucose-1-phosphate uridylyltransferase [Pyronema domesticum]|uniref:UDP-N-acetylglucosamine diphosphorylase n=1 Tax=Pyronema omphalodes (strain CBS 100304) TaxID=1076935 RepID=U4L0P9_PYROM|nr:UTP-glucose-1-phosphate uridylyltransferase [Pyronema domesticum]CCX08913.1 Similar to UDP-N-acetylglucosamine pyrophosphorylase; acc. no. O74933 [Pyronema omphalodes CBS 100304]